jgi:hypothetical protein
LACIGYRTVGPVFFRSENKNAAQKVHLKKGGKPAEFYTENTLSAGPSEDHNEELLDDGMTYLTDETRESASLTLRNALALPIDECALAYLMNCYTPDSSFDYLVDISISCSSSPALSEAIASAAFAALYTERHEKGLLRSARMHCTEALGQINRALLSDATAALDSTLIAVLLLTLFEACFHAGPESGTPKTWTTHNMGALSLLRLRGQAQFETLLGRRLFTQVAANMGASCVQMHTLVPEDLIVLHGQASIGSGMQGLGLQIGLLLDRMAEVRATPASQCMTPEQGEAFIAQLFELDNDVAYLLAMTSDEWHADPHPMQIVRWRSALQMMRFATRADSLDDGHPDELCRHHLLRRRRLLCHCKSCVLRHPREHRPLSGWQWPL